MVNPGRACHDRHGAAVTVGDGVHAHVHGEVPSAIYGLRFGVLDDGEATGGATDHMDVGIDPGD